MLADYIYLSGVSGRKGTISKNCNVLYPSVPYLFLQLWWPQPHSTDNNYPGKQIDLIAAEFGALLAERAFQTFSNQIVFEHNF